MKIKWQYLATRVADWVSHNSFKPLDAERTLRVMQANVTRLAPHSQQPAFIKLFGPIDEKYLVQDLAATCNEARKEWITDSQSKFTPKGFDFKIAAEAIDRVDQQLDLTGKKFELPTLGSLRLSLPRSTSSGAPDFWTPKAEVMEDALLYVGQVLLGLIVLPPVKFFWPVVVAWRSQMRAGGERTRIIHVFPHVVSVLEQFFAQPFFDHFSQRIGMTCYSFGSNWLDNRDFYIEMNQKFKYIIEIDYKSFDKSVKPLLMKLFYTSMKLKLNIKSSHISKIYDWICDYHMHATILTSWDGEVATIDNKQNGVLSGSVFTNLIDSWINLFVMNYILIELGINDYATRVMGDDCVLAQNAMPAQQLLDIIKDKAKSKFGLEVGDKSKIRERWEPIFYMGFLMNENFKYMPVDLMKRKMTFTGRFIPEDELDNRMVVFSKFCSICSVSSNGYLFWKRYKPELLAILDIDEPDYYHDLTEGPGKPFSTKRIITDVEQNVRDAWRYA